jgi:hypothetical protein
MDDSGYWPTGSSDFSSIKFEDGFLKLTALTDLDGWRLNYPVLENFYLEAVVKSPECEGDDHFGLMFRAPEKSDATKGYLFGITCDGRYSLRRWDGATMYYPVNWTESDEINQGVNAVNVLGIMAKGTTLTLYVNGEKLKEVSDNAYLKGQYGVFVGGINTENLTVWVDQIRYWVIP